MYRPYPERATSTNDGINRALPSARARKPGTARLAAGFSFLETLVTIAIIGIAAAMSYTILTYVLTTIRSDSALQGMVAQMRQARQASLDQRRNVLVTFQGTGELVALRQNLDLSTTPLSDYFLPNGVVYMVSPGVPDTPDGYGNAKAVNFNCASLPCTITFQSDGSVLDSTGNYVNGTVFIGKASQTLAARAVTILGATGRIKGYRYNGSAWL